MNLKQLAIEFGQELSIMEHELTHSVVQEKALEKCITLLQQFDSFISINPFKSHEDEIEYFKEIRQIPQHNLIYFYKLRKFHLYAPEFQVKQLKKFTQVEIRKINSFFQKHLDFIQYIDGKETLLDAFYFKRNQPKISTQYSLDYLLTPNLHTTHDVILSKVMAYRKYGRFLSRKLKSFEPKTKNNRSARTDTPALYWTGSKAGLTELIYSLYHAGVLNRGQADIKEIATILEQTFNFELGDFYHTFIEIRYRKKSRTKFLDELSEKLISAMDQYLE